MNCNIMKYVIVPAFLISAILVVPAYAHKVNIFAYSENGKIYTESYFPDGRPVEGGTIDVLDSQSHKLAEFKTDKEGKCSFPIPKMDDLTIVINASMGHRNTFLLKKSELGE
jgi:nickel transport protein